MNPADWPDDFYDVLEVSHSARASIIQAAYRRLAKDNHPDNHPDDPGAADRLKRINAAYEVLGDPAHREAYDRACGFTGPSSALGATASGPASPADRPVLEIDPPRVLLTPDQGTSHAQFSVVARQVSGPPWVAGKHVLDLVAEPPWDLDTFSRVEISPEGPPFVVTFEVRLSALKPDTLYSAGLLLEVRVVS
jgi:hypothetical protein